MIVQKSFEPANTGTLYLVGTPIGNLEDMTYRAVRTLKEVDWIAAEDTRQTRKLLAHFGIAGRLVSYREHNKETAGEALLKRLLAGESVALVSDAGLPAISDPGSELVALAAANRVPVVPVPGANAALSALIASGLSTAQFAFIGFLPRERKSLREELERWKCASATLLIYEAPHRIAKTLEALLEVWGDRRIVLARELTKKHEEFARGAISECIALLKERQPLGEYVIVVEGAQGGCGMQPAARETWWSGLSVAQHVERYMKQEGLTSKEAIKRAAADRGERTRDVYNRYLAEKPPGRAWPEGLEEIEKG